MSKFILISGMHRSGTSALTGFLKENGVNVGNVDKSNPFNPKGNVEQRLVSVVNEKVLRMSGGTWMNPNIRNISWSPFLIDIKEAILNSLSESKIYAIKDPRFVFVYEEWLKNIPNYQIVICFRNPLAVAQSLHLRDGIKLEYGLDLWKRYNLQILQMNLSENIHFVHFTGNSEIDCPQYERLHKSLNLEAPIKMDFYDSNICKNSKMRSINIEYDPYLLKIYDALKKKC